MGAHHSPRLRQILVRALDAVVKHRNALPTHLMLVTLGDKKTWWRTLKGRESGYGSDRILQAINQLGFRVEIHLIEQELNLEQLQWYEKPRPKSHYPTSKTSSELGQSSLASITIHFLTDRLSREGVGEIQADRDN